MQGDGKVGPDLDPVYGNKVLRFAWINLKMVRMISIGHHGRAPLRPIVWPEGSDPKGKSQVKAR